MFRPMRRARQQILEKDAIEILKQETSGVLALFGDNGYPYAVPMSYVLEDNRIIFHSATTGHKIDAIRNSDKASFCVIHKDDIIPDEYTTVYQSVIAFGTLRILADDEARLAAQTLGKKYRPGFEQELADTVERNLDKMTIFVLEIEHLTGKQAKELVSE